MKKKLTIIGLVLLYILSCFASWYMIKWDYENRWKELNPGLADLVTVFTPVLNTFYCSWWLLESRVVINYNKFFGIEEREKPFWR